jgi:SAM-dependent methyltransferase
MSRVTAEPDTGGLLGEAAKFYWYHCVELAPGVATDGVYDMREALPRYGFPERMEGMDVLDVGRASGFFAFEFERRGARVVATDIPSLAEWDWVGGKDVQATRSSLYGGPGEAEEHINGAFRFAKRARGSKVEEKTINVYDLDPSAFGDKKFDLVFAGSIASHLRDPVLAFERLRSVTDGTCVVAAPSFDIPAVADYAMMSLVGTADEDLRSWWVMNARGLSETLSSAGFAQVEIVSSFQLKHRHLPLTVDHLVAHAGS